VLIQPDVETLVDLPLVLGSKDRKPAELAGGIRVRPSASLGIESHDLDHSNASGNHGRFYLQRSQQILPLLNSSSGM
jgi:hypothetical protein